MMTQTGTVQASQQPVLSDAILSSNNASSFGPYLEKAFSTETQLLTDTSPGEPLRLDPQEDKPNSEATYPNPETFTLRNENNDNVSESTTTLSQNMTARGSRICGTLLKNNIIAEGTPNGKSFLTSSKLNTSLKSSKTRQKDLLPPGEITEKLKNNPLKENIIETEHFTPSPAPKYFYSEESSPGTSNPGIFSIQSEVLKETTIMPEVHASTKQVYRSSEKQIPQLADKWDQKLSPSNGKEVIPIIKSPPTSEDFLLRKAITITDSTGNIIQPPPLTADSTLSLQLQKLVHTGNETGTVMIQGTFTRTALQTTIKTENEYEGFVPPQFTEQLWKSEKPGQQTGSLRQNILGQYFEAKANSRDHNTYSPQFTDDPLQKETNQHSTSPLQQSIQDPADPLNNPQYISHSLQDTPGQLSNSSSKAVFLSSGIVVYEEDIIQQMVDRFQLIKQPNDNRLTLKLHPKELGELRIDLTVKEGSIKANVLAQSHQIQQIVERNLPKLKNSLVAQGYTIDEILVTSQSDSVADFNFFEQQLSQRNNDPSPVTDKEKSTAFNTIIEDVVQKTIHSSSGLNIKV